MRENEQRFTIDATDGRERGTFATTDSFLFYLDDGEFIKLEPKDREDYLGDLIKELAESVPIPKERFHINKVQLQYNYHYFNYDYFGSGAYISVGINEINETSDMSINSIIQILNTMCELYWSYEYTPIGIGNKTRHVKRSYGFKRARK